MLIFDPFQSISCYHGISPLQNIAFNHNYHLSQISFKMIYLEWYLILRMMNLKWFEMRLSKLLS